MRNALLLLPTAELPNPCAYQPVPPPSTGRGNLSKLSRSICASLRSKNAWSLSTPGGTLTNGQAPAGWYPTPDGRQRYWDGSRWTAHVAPDPAAQWAPAARPFPVPPAATRPWYSRPELLIPAVIIGGLLVIVWFVAALGAVSNTTLSEGSVSISTGSEVDETEAPAPTPSSTPDTPKTVSPTTPPAKPTVEAAPSPYGPQPKVQKAVVKAVAVAQAKADDAENDLQRGGVLRTRTRAICSVMDSMKVTNWTGQVSNLDANSDGKGVVAIRIADGAEVKTWNNSLSDIGDETLIEPESKLFDQVMALEEDQVVKFSGTFFKDDANCLEEGSMTLGGNLSEPEFVFRFSSVTPVR